MNVGDLVRPMKEFYTAPEEEEWMGIIIAWEQDNPIVFWSEKYPEELEYTHQLETINENRRPSKIR